MDLGPGNAIIQKGKGSKVMWSRASRIVRSSLSGFETLRRFVRFLLQHVSSSKIRGSIMRIVYSNYEPFVTRVFTTLLEDGMTVLDIGAAWGYYSSLAATKVGPEGHVIAFEADPLNFQALLKTVKASKSTNITPVPFAVSSVNGIFGFYSTGVFGNSSLHYSTRHERKFLVKTVRLDDFLTPNTKVGLIKMDIDGSELFAFNGMTRLVQSNQRIKIITEFCPRLLVKAGSNPREYLVTLIDYGFNIFHIDEHRNQLVARCIDQLLTISSSRAIMLLCIRSKHQSA